jgi:hypothetical protein
MLPLCVLPLLWLAACRDDSVTAYRVPKEKDPEMSAAAPASAGTTDGGSMASTAVPTAQGGDLTWKAPADWQTMPAAAMRKATYSISGEGGAKAELSITAFPGDVGGELANINRWRGQIQLPPLAESDLAGTVTRTEQNNLHFAVVDFVGKSPAGPQRILGAIVPANGATWFFKITGPDGLVENQKPTFEAFLKTIAAPGAP